MAVRAHLDLQVVAKRRAGVEGVPAAAGHRDLFVLGVNSVFHDCCLPCAGSTKKARSVATRVRARKKKSAEKPFRRQLPGSRAIRGRLSTKLVDKCVDDRGAPYGASLQKCDIVKLLNFSPVVFDLCAQ